MKNQRVCSIAGKREEWELANGSRVAVLTVWYETRGTRGKRQPSDRICAGPPNRGGIVSKKKEVKDSQKSLFPRVYLTIWDPATGDTPSPTRGKNKTPVIAGANHKR